MQSLISGAECAVPSNPLSQVLKHAEGDRSLQRDRVGGPSSSQLRQLPPGSASNVNAADLAMAKQFFQPGPQPSAFQRPPPGASRELLEKWSHDSSSTAFHLPDVDTPHWAHSMNVPPTATSLSGTKWSDEFGYGPSVNAGPSMTYQINDSHSTVPYSMGEYMPIPRAFFQSSMPSQLLHPNMNWDQEFSRVEGKGKEKATDAEFDAAFARATASITTIKEDSRIIEVQDGTESLEAALERAKITDPPEKFQEDDSEYLSDFQKVWDRLRNSELPPPEDDLAKWESEFNQVLQARRDQLNFDEDMQNAWKSDDFDDDNLPVQPTSFDDEGMPVLEPYNFEPNNAYLVNETSHLARAKQLLEQNGSLTEAALLLEAAIQHGDTGVGGYEAWILLGETRSMDEREEAAMKALTEGVRKAQESGNTGEGMLSLAISYTNESYDRAAYTTLHRWLNARFPYLIPEELKGPLPSSPWASHSRATDAFLTVARQQHAQGEMDPDVQIGLGVLFYSNSEFDKAKDCFASALAARPKDYLLWNRLGSCLSNGSKPEEALGVYREALQLRPTYTRAIYNVGVACLNIGAYKEAAEHFLSALSMQESAGDKSDQLWQTLRKCFLSMDRQDLADRAKPGEALQTFRREGFDF